LTIETATQNFSTAQFYFLSANVIINFKTISLLHPAEGTGMSVTASTENKMKIIPPPWKQFISSLLKKEVLMFVRLTYLGFLPGKIEEAKKIYYDELVPVVKQQKGNLDCTMLEPVDSTDDYISMTLWDNKEDADAYQNSGTYKQLVDRVQALYSKNPVLKVYSTEKIMEHA
jgi:heme-degrading monooxygenase HmoA